ncbi:MAG TPA: choice-of-anchor Q domain-containing protein [Anaerolineaceae bacterium]|nr:choice-of-anchor Q domain-containing protein [Anaerolineaceae bacterium]
MDKSRQALHFLLIAALLLLPLSSNPASANLPNTALSEAIVYYVKQGASGDCFSWPTACDLQTALTHPIAPDHIWVAAGTYKPTTTGDRSATFQLVSGVEVYGGFPADGGGWETRDWNANPTILSGDISAEGGNTDNSFHVVTASGVNASAILDGFSITAGNTTGDTVQPAYGGGMFSMTGSPTLANLLFIGNTASFGGGGMANFIGSNPTLTNVFFTGNSAQFGGGIDNFNSNPTLTNVTIYGNSASNGGGIGNYVSSNPTLTNVTISGNTAYFGGGMFIESGSPTFSQVSFYDNSAADQGGGLFNATGGLPTLTDVIFSNNTSQDAGGGIYNASSGLVLSRVLFSGNTAGSGGGMFNQACSPSLTNVTFSGNTSSGDGGGLYNNDHSNPNLTNATISVNSANNGGGGGGMFNYNQSWPVLTNAIIWANSPSQIWGNATITYSIVQGGFSGTGNLDQNPLLLPLADNGGFSQTHALDIESPAIDSGTNANCPAVDQRGFMRPVDGDLNEPATCDMGAYEFGSSLNGFTLSVEIIGSGSVTKNPDQTGYLYGDEVTLSATADPGWSFEGWSGDASSSDNPLTITILDDTSITATFLQDEYFLEVDVAPDESGSVEVSPPKTTYHYGEEVTLTPLAFPGWSFLEWSGDASGSEHPLTYTILGDTSITATFTQDYYTLTVTPIGSGSVSVEPLWDTYMFGDEVTLTATADPGWNFAGWGGNAGGSDNPLLVTIYGNTGITALFTTNWLFLPMITR